MNVCAPEEMNVIRMFKHMSNSISYSHPKWDLWMVAALVCVAVVLGIYPADRTVWCVEMVWAVGLWAVLLLTRRRTSSATPSARSAPRRFSCAEKRDLHDEEK